MLSVLSTFVKLFLQLFEQCVHCVQCHIVVLCKLFVTELFSFDSFSDVIEQLFVACDTSVYVSCSALPFVLCAFMSFLSLF